MTGVHQLPPQKWLEFAYNGLERFDINMVQHFVQNLDIYLPPIYGQWRPM